MSSVTLDRPTETDQIAAIPAEVPERTDRYHVSVEEYINFQRNGFLVVKNLVPPEEIAELRQHTDDLMQGRLPEQNRQMKEGDKPGHGVAVQGLDAPPAHLSPDEKAQYFLRIHMLHRQLELHERYMLHPRVLDVLEAIIGPDVLALQTMLFLKPPGKPGQGWHQDRFYIPTHPNTLCGAWIAIDDTDEQNGAMWMALGSGNEPVYPPHANLGYGAFGQRDLENIKYVDGVSDPDDEKNDLSKIADKYPQVLVSARAGDVVFFNGHILHRSKKNWTTDRYRRSFVSHYCNARSFTQWGADVQGTEFGADTVDPITGMTNGSHILARGDTHLPFAFPKFGTPCAALLSSEQRRTQSEHAATMMGDMDSGLMGTVPADPDIAHDHDAPKANSSGY